MAVWYVRTDATGNNAGTGPSTTQAVKSLANIAAKAVQPGDVVAMAPGSTFRELWTMGWSGAAGNPITIFGDVFGGYFQGADVPVVPGPILISGYTTNSRTAPSTTAPTVDLNAKSYLTFQNLIVSGTAVTTNGNCIRATATHSRGITLRQCCLKSSLAAVMVQYNGVAATPADWLIERCIFAQFGGGGGYCLTVAPADPAQAGDFDINVLAVNSRFYTIGNSSGLRILGPATASAGGKPGGLRVRSCRVYAGGGNAIIASGANLSTTIPAADAYDSVLCGNAALNATTAGQTVNNNCWLQGGLTNATAGAASVSGSGLELMEHLNEEMLWGGDPRPFLMPYAASPVLGFGTAGTSPAPPTVDIANRARPSGGGSLLNGIGDLERHDVAAPGGAADADGAVDNCHMIVGPGDQDYPFAVNPESTTISIKVRWDGNHGDATKPLLTLLPAPEIGFAGESKTPATAGGTGAALNAYEQVSFTPFTPTGYGVVILRVQARPTAAAGVVKLDTAGAA